MKHFRYVFAVVAALLLAAGAFAQTTGSIQGTVVDENGAALPGVTVEATSPNMQGSKVAVSDTAGKFRLVLLPPGMYSVTFNLSGFAATEQTGIQVGLGRTVTLQVEMRSAFEEEVVVSGAAPNIDVRSTELGVNVSKEFFLNLPVERNYASVVQVAPGTARDDSGVTVYGSSGAENIYIIDGVNTTGVELGQQGKTLNFEFIQEVQVKTGGYQAEFGRATGGLVNVLTKSGGNEFHGDVFGYYDSADLRSNLSSDITSSADFNSRSYLESNETRQDYGVDIGGFLVKDQLWFYGAFDSLKDEVDREVAKDFTSLGGPDAGDVYTATTNRDLWAAKLTWRAGQNHSIVLSGFGDPGDFKGPNRSLAGPESSFLMAIDSGGTDATLKYEGVLGSSVVITAQAAQHKEKQLEGGPYENIVATFDYTSPILAETGIVPNTTGGYGFFQKQKFGRDVYKGDLSYFLNDFGGDHEFKVGVEREDISVKNSNYNSGGQRIYVFQRTHALTGETVTYYRHRFFASSKKDAMDYTNADILHPLSVDTKSENLAWFGQDTWRATPNLTFNIGLRYEEQKLYDGFGDVAQKVKDEWAPRLGFIWDPRGDGTSKVFGSWGRFYETIPMDIVIRSYGGEITVFNYNYHGALDDPDRFNVECDPDVNANVRRCSPLGGGVSPVDPGTKGQYIEEAIVGGEMEVMKDFAVGAKYIWRDLGRVMEDSLNANLDYYIGNPGEGLLTEAIDMSYEHGLPIPKPKRTFKAIELTARKRFSNNWQMIASYIWSKLEGNYDGTFQASTGQLDPNLNSAFDYAEFQVHNEGYLSNDRRHSFKVDGYYMFPFGLNVGLSAYYRTGTPITAMGYSINYHNWEFYLSNRGDFGRTDDEFEADLHLGYPIKLGGFEINLLADVFNLLNRQGETGVDQRYNTDEIHTVIDYDTGLAVGAIPGGTPCTSTPEGAANPDACNPSFKASNSWQDPRTIRLGVRVTF